MFLFWNVVVALFSSSPAVKKHLCFTRQKRTLPSSSHIHLIKSKHLSNEHTCTHLTDVRRACLHVHGNELFVLLDRRQNDGSFFALVDGHCKPFWCVASIGDSLYDYRPVSIWRKMFGVLCDMVFSRFFLMYPAAVFNPLPSCIQTYLQGFMMTYFGNQRRMYYSYPSINWVTYMRSEDDNLQGHKSVWTAKGLK